MSFWIEIDCSASALSWSDARQLSSYGHIRVMLSRHHFLLLIIGC